MSYIDGFVIPGPLEKKQAYIEMARTAQAIYLEYGARVIYGGFSTLLDSNSK